MEVVLRHPGDAKVTTSKPDAAIGGAYEIWISDGDIVRTFASAHQLGTQRPVRNRPRGLADKDFPGAARVYESVTALPMETLPDTFVHPAGYCQNVLATGRCTVVGTEIVLGREAIVLESAHPRTIELAADRPDFRIVIAVDRELGVIVRLVETIGGDVTRHAEVTDLGPDAPLPPSAFDFVFPTGTTMLF
jgi:outer membrane lipoprotein-sorting protein